MAVPTSGNVLELALRRLGFDDFRSGQRQAIEALLERRSLLLVAPTGGGKSLCYQLPAVLLSGTTIVVSPLISLMHDQVQALQKRDVQATYFASTVPADEMRRRSEVARNGGYKLIYVAPERLRIDGFRTLLAALDCPLVAIDEAHCISEWGHDFRPDYLALGDLVESVGAPHVLACTATATPVVRDEIVTRLRMPADTPQLLHGFARPNLALRSTEVRSARDRMLHTDAVLCEAIGEPSQPTGTVIVYARTRKATEAESARLQAAGWRADAYHAGLGGQHRDRVQTAFMESELDVVVATNAFGMGIDRADVRAVIHLGPPGSIEAYYQEVGRAGRDGEPAIGLLMISPQDLPLRRRLLELDNGQNAVDPAITEHKWNLFLELIRWSEGGSCRHDAILRYFGDEAETLDGCGRCDVCLTLEGDGTAEDLEETTLLVRKALSAVARVHRRFGVTAAVKLLRGESDPRLQRSGLDQTPTFGVLGEHSSDWLMRLTRRMVTAGWVDFTPGDRPVVLLTEAGRETMKGNRPARIILPPTSLPSARTARQRSGSRASQADATPMSFDEERLFERLRRFRSEQAKEKSVPAYFVAGDRTLRDIARLRPKNLLQLETCFGIGPAKAKEYGAGLLAAVADEAPASPGHGQEPT